MRQTRRPLFRPRTLPKQQTEQPVCEHTWQLFKQSVTPERTNMTLGGGYERNYQWDADYHFVVRGCTKCKTKEYIDYVKKDRNI